jgi:outer membrane protein TolC
MIPDRTISLGACGWACVFALASASFCFPAEPPPGLDLTTVVQATLRGNPEVLGQQQEIESRRGAVTQARGTFQPVLRTNLIHDQHIRPLTDSDAKALGGRSFLPIKTTNYQVGLERVFRNGTTIRPGIEFSRVDSDIPASDPENRAEVKFDVLHPLARDRGDQGAAVKLEEASRLALEAERFTLHAVVQRALSQSLVTYWSYLGAARRLEILVTAEERAKLLASQTAELIRGDVTPASERSQVEANLAAKQAERIAGETQLRQERRALGLLLGISPEGIETLPVPIATFPDLDLAAVLPVATLTEELVQSTLATRPDLASLLLQSEAAARRTAGGRNQERPRIDLNVSVGYSGLDQNSRLTSYVSPFSKQVRGLNAALQIQTELPLKDLTAQGRRQQYEADEAKLEIAADTTIRTIKSGVALALTTVVDSLRQSQCTRLAVDSYRQAVENEKAKLAQGMSTILDLITLEDRLTGTMLAHIQAQVALAQALVVLRFETGTLSVFDGDAFAVDPLSLTSFFLPASAFASASDSVSTPPPSPPSLSIPFSSPASPTSESP